jgi:hypothetical protein
MRATGIARASALRRVVMVSSTAPPEETFSRPV